MSDKINGFTVVFDKSVSTEYMDMVKQSISLMKGVCSIEPVVEGTDSYMGAIQEANRIRRFLVDAIQNDFGNKKLKQ